MEFQRVWSQQRSFFPRWPQQDEELSQGTKCATNGSLCYALPSHRIANFRLALQGWLDQSQSLSNFGSLPGLGPGHPSSGLGQSLRQESFNHDPDEELIPTAIVIKNIPFAVKKEQLVSLMTELRLPLPYAFNYHFDNGVFRGLAFANFTTADETASVIDALNHFELHGRKLRVEYKKMLPLAERERIEREKRERRGQLEEQHRPLGGTLQTQASFSSLTSHVPATSPSPVSGRPSKMGAYYLHRVI